MATANAADEVNRFFNKLREVIPAVQKSKGIDRLFEKNEQILTKTDNA